MQSLRIAVGRRPRQMQLGPSIAEHAANPTDFSTESRASTASTASTIYITSVPPTNPAVTIIPAAAAATNSSTAALNGILSNGHAGHYSKPRCRPSPGRV